jgi:hypothetical protein
MRAVHAQPAWYAETLPVLQGLFANLETAEDKRIEIQTQLFDS